MTDDTPTPCPFCKATLERWGGYYACPNKACSFPMGIAPAPPVPQAGPVDEDSPNYPPAREDYHDALRWVLPDLAERNAAIDRIMAAPASPDLEAKAREILSQNRLDTVWQLRQLFGLPDPPPNKWAPEGKAETAQAPDLEAERKAWEAWWRPYKLESWARLDIVSWDTWQAARLRSQGEAPQGRLWEPIKGSEAIAPALDAEGVGERSEPSKSPSESSQPHGNTQVTAAPTKPQGEA